MEHAHDLGDHLELVLWDVQPRIERLCHLSSDLLSRDGVYVRERLQQCLYSGQDTRLA